MHSRSLKTIDPRIPTMPGRSTSGFHRPGRFRVHQARSAVRLSASVSCMLRITCEADFRTFCIRSCISGDSFEFVYLISWCGHFQRQQKKGVVYSVCAWP